MQELIDQLQRLYFSNGAAPARLAERLAGAECAPVALAEAGQTRALVLPFARLREDAATGHWDRLCRVANALQDELRLPAAAVSMSGGGGYALWLSFAAPEPVARVQQLADAVRAAYCPEQPAVPVDAPVELPPCLHQPSGKWSAFIHPGMGASFADEPGLDMTPPPAAQAAFLEGLESIAAAQLQEVLDRLGRAAAPQAQAPAPRTQVAPAGLLLKDATLEDIVRHLHGLNIEPTFRHLLVRGPGRD